MGYIKHLDFNNVSDKESWQTYLDKQGDAHVTDQPEWRLLFHELYGIKNFSYAYCDQQEVSGIVSVYLFRSPFLGKFLTTSPFFGYGGLYADTTEIEKKLLEKIEQIAAEIRVDYIEFRLRRRLNDRYRCNTHFVDCDLDLSRSPDIIWKTSLQSNVRQNIRKSQKFELDFQFTDNAKPTFNLISQAIRDLGTPYHSYKFFELIGKYFPDNIRYSNVIFKNRVLAAGIVLTYRNTISTPYIGSLQSHRYTRANYCQYWEIIKRASQDGKSIFEMGRSPANSTHIKFKQKWGSQAVDLFYNYLVINPRKAYQSVSHPSRIQRIGTEAWKILPLFMTRRIGPLFFRHIP